ncbi:MAG: hypothetical protein FWC40_04470 [Proteobacteria bacterium]|nr:hypothetical protein [Pseudomonadota bacterium]
MKLNRWMMVLATLSLSAGLAACDDAADGNTAECKANEKKCSGGATAMVCKDGKWETTTCDAGTACQDGACLPSGNCQGNEKKCNVNGTASVCKDGQWELVICEGSTECKDGVCVQKAECKPSEHVLTCVGNSIQSCGQDGAYKLEPCGVEKKCDDGQCVDPCVGVQCGDGEVCSQGTCVVARPATPIGAACTCESDCTITVTGKELKDALGLMVLALVGNDIKDNEMITAPNFFSKSISGCDGVVPPAGMTVGCMYDTTITFPDSLIAVLDKAESIIAGLALIGINIEELLGDLDLFAIITPVKALLTAGIPFTSPNGYCLTAAINIDGQLDQSLELFVNPSKIFGAGGLISKITTGDHAKASTAPCPAGTEKFSYTLISETEGMGAIDVGFDMCLRGCDTHADCRTSEGYSCVEIPNGVPGEGQTVDDLPTKKACFDKSNIEYFTGLTNLFSDLF